MESSIATYVSRGGLHFSAEAAEALADAEDPSIHIFTADAAVRTAGFFCACVEIIPKKIKDKKNRNVFR